MHIPISPSPVETRVAPLTVTLHRYPDIGLIVKARTNVVFSNQTGGFSCRHPEVEGFFVPLRTPFGLRELFALRRLAFSDFDEGIDEGTADNLEQILRHQDLGCIQVDRSRLGESWEAWVHVTVTGDLGYKVPFLGPIPDKLEAVLTWLNSD